jgi:hypothetical protein
MPTIVMITEVAPTKIVAIRDALVLRPVDFKMVGP